MLSLFQIDDLVDDAVQYFQERHFDGVGQVYLKYQLTEQDIERGRAPEEAPTAGIANTSASVNIAGVSTSFTYKESGKFLTSSTRYY